MVSAAHRLRVQSRKDLKRELSAVLTTTRGALALWKENVRSDQELLSKLPIIHQLIENKLIQSNADTLRKALTPWIQGHRYLGYALFRNEHNGPRLVLEQYIKWNDLFVKSQHVLNKALEGEFTMSKPLVLGPHDIITVTASPIFDEKGKTIGVMCFVVDLMTWFTEATQLGRMGVSGETYAVDERGQMITPSRFKDYPGKPGVTRHPLFLQKNHVFSQKVNYNLEGYVDYRGIPVIGAWTWDEDLSLGIITEIDKAEAYRSFSTSQNLIWFMSVVVLVGMCLMLFLRELLVRNKINSLKLMEESRKKLLSMVSHDLKNPLSSLLITNDILMKTLPWESETFLRNRQLLEKNHRAAEQMKKLINDLLDSSRIEAGKMEIHLAECDGRRLLHQNIELLEPTATAKNIVLKEDVPMDLPSISADVERLSQVFSNILGNAVKFTPPGGKVTASARTVDGHVQFSITDTGPGIPDEELPHLFDRFWQADQTKELGTGLGLAISKELVMAHGGEIWVDSELGKGSSFHFVIPTWQVK